MARNVSTYKLVRDKIPAIIAASGRDPEIRILTDTTKREKALFKKLREETKELETATPENREEEMADVIEVLGAIMLHLDIDNQKVFDVIASKREEKGAFETFTELKGSWGK